MTPIPHTYGSNCRLAPIPQRPSENGMPQIVSQFFYSSLIPINELLSNQRYSSTSDNKSVKRQLRPFDRGDNNALEKAWMSLPSDQYRTEHEAIRAGRYESLSPSPGLLRLRQKLVEALALKHLELHAGTLYGLPLNNNAASTSAEMGELPACCPVLRSDASEMLQQHFCALARKAFPELTIEATEREVIETMTAINKTKIDTFDSEQNSVLGNLSARRREAVSLQVQASPTTSAGRIVARQGRPQSSSRTTPSLSGQTAMDVPAPPRLPGTSVGMAGDSFTQAGSKSGFTTPRASTSDGRQQLSTSKYHGDDRIALRHHVPDAKKETESEASVLDVVVGISRLHKVSLPALLMKPIYWSPVNDVAVVMRATWFYRDTMMPVAPLVANQLEAGYQELKPWTETWRDELNCAVEVGSLGEEKISYCLWPQDSKYFNSEMQKREPRISAEAFCSAHCCRGDAAAQGSIDPIVEGSSSNKEGISRAFSNYHVIYKDEKRAFLLKPSLRPSAYYGRRPASKIVKGFAVGIPVVRGFDSQAWDRIYGHGHVPDRDKETRQIAEPTSHSHENNEDRPCDACEADKDNGQVTDLILVAHGIGQKFAERVESFHFTHAINGFRRAVNEEMRNPIIQHITRQDQNGVMILPLNWRMGLSFEDGGPGNHQTSEQQTNESFGLKDIEPNTIPAIRSMISDVMFDIPFYMSHHKSKMVNALVSEANRVYRLWCRNNPGFADRGRVHLIAHSLGSVMAVDILSRQPTEVPRLDLERVEPERQFFEFDTTNLFLLGSPAGFFLLLEHGALTPRRGRRKPGADPRDIMDENIVSDAGRFGCLAVDNIYNILAKEDPIAYLLNGAVDPAYASALKPAYVPSTSTSIFKSVGDVMRQIVPGLSLPTNPLATHPERPSIIRLPSQLELEIHDFTREEIAEKRVFLLNDNGQIDWFLRSGSGPLEIQYLNMLSAHTSYWINQDFVRMLCLEIGRRPGRNFSIPVMRAVKGTKRFSLER
ncbi:DDHD domain protein [Metarhizium guizhouense ARSEF 977]|uniref:DDHD domain protein n=1 Tax=Metarhizium guizhouense (strain ARSEF 977) TaxID=1276136 RepID=A0A0B4HL59_METGA|nr:DDHD domain protein [Metarhizium guizhouense ARSEF 977]